MTVMPVEAAEVTPVKAVITADAMSHTEPVIAAIAHGERAAGKAVTATEAAAMAHHEWDGAAATKTATTATKAAMTAAAKALGMTTAAKTAAMTAAAAASHRCCCRTDRQRCG